MQKRMNTVNENGIQLIQIGYVLIMSTQMLNIEWKNQQFSREIKLCQRSFKISVSWQKFAGLTDRVHAVNYDSWNCYGIHQS